MRVSRRTKFLLAAAAAGTFGVATVAVAGVAGHHAMDAPSERTNNPVVYGRIQTPGAPAIPNVTSSSDAVTQISAGLDANAFVSLTLGSAPRADTWQGTWFYATVRGASRRPSDYLASVWQADLAQGAIAEVLDSGQNNLANVIVGSTISVQLPDGSSFVAGGRCR